MWERCSTRTDGENSNGQHARGVMPLYGHIVRLPRLVGFVTTRNRRSCYTHIYDVRFPLFVAFCRLAFRAFLDTRYAELQTAVK